VGGIVENAGFNSPCQLATLKTGGDTDTQDMEKLVSEMNPVVKANNGLPISSSGCRNSSALCCAV
jgi:hypothetical protein